MGTRTAEDWPVRRPDNLDRLLHLLDQAEVERLWSACRTDSAAPYRALLEVIGQRAAASRSMAPWVHRVAP